MDPILFAKMLISVFGEVSNLTDGMTNQINNRCAEKHLPPALPGNTDYRFEGFGITLGLPPKFTFFVHYKPGASEHVDLGKFEVPISFSQMGSLAAAVGHHVT